MRGLGAMRGARLNSRQESFCRHYVAARANASAAYRAAGYRVKSGDVAAAAASRLLKHVRVQARIERLQAMAAKRAVDVTIDSHIADLDEIRQQGLADKQLGPAVSATVAMAKITGHMIERRETGKPGQFDGMTEAELRAFVYGDSAIPGDRPSGLNAGNGAGDSADPAGDAGDSMPVPTHKPSGSVN